MLCASFVLQGGRRRGGGGGGGEGGGDAGKRWFCFGHLADIAPVAEPGYSLIICCNRRKNFGMARAEREEKRRKKKEKGKKEEKKKVSRQPLIAKRNLVRQIVCACAVLQ